MRIFIVFLFQKYISKYGSEYPYNTFKVTIIGCGLILLRVRNTLHTKLYYLMIIFKHIETRIRFITFLRIM